MLHNFSTLLLFKPSWHFYHSKYLQLWKVPCSSMIPPLSSIIVVGGSDYAGSWNFSLQVIYMYLEFGLILIFSDFGLIWRCSCIKSQRSNLVQVCQVFLGCCLWGQLQRTVCNRADRWWNIFWAPRGARRRSIYESNSARWWETEAKLLVLLCPLTTNSCIKYTNKEFFHYYFTLQMVSDSSTLMRENTDKLRSLLLGISELNRWT